MKTNPSFPSLSTLLSLVSMLFISTIYAQNPAIRVFEDWSDTSGTQNDFQRTVVRSKAIGGTTYYYVCGATLNSSGDYDILTRKLDASGNELWTQTYSGSGNGDDFGADIQIDNVGNVYVCGLYYKDATDSTNAIILKYNAAGTYKWAYTYNGTGSRNDVFATMQVSANAVIAGGTTWKNSTNKYDFLMARLDSNGTQIWLNSWDYLNLNDAAVNVYNNGSKIYIAGGAQSATTTYKYAALNVRASDGAVLGNAVTGGTAFGIDQVTDLKVDANQNIYITGSALDMSAMYDIRTIKLDTALNILWSHSYDGGTGANDFGSGVTIDQSGNVIVCGTSQTSSNGTNYVVLKYNSSGTLLWDETYNGTANGNDSATAVVVHPTDTNKIYVTGYSFNGSTKDYYTLKYDAAGTRKWEIGYNNIYNGDDRTFAITLDTTGNVIVTGQNKWNDSTYVYTTVKYVELEVYDPADTTAILNLKSVFTVNVGQLISTDSTLCPEVKYYCSSISPTVYFQDTTISFVFAKLDTSSLNQDTLHRVDLKYLGRNNDVQIRPLTARDEYSNYYLGHTGNGREHVLNYNELVTLGVWNNIDVIHRTNQSWLKTYYICQPGGGGGSVNLIHLKYEGADSISLSPSGQLIVHTTLGELTLEKPAAWQIDANGNYQSIGWQPNYSIIGLNEVKLTGIGSYNATLPLVVAIYREYTTITSSATDNLVWSTFEGGANEDSYISVSANFSNYISAGGYTYSLNFPNTVGQLQSSNGGGKDGIVRLYNYGNPLWATYYGGNGTDQVYSVSSNGGTTSVYVVGSTYSADFPVGSINLNYLFQPYSATTGGPSDAFILQLNGNGQRVWATCYGSATGNEVATIVKATNQFNSFYVAGYGADGSTPLTTQSGASNLTIGDAFILKYNPLNFAREWATLYGGTVSATNRTQIKDLEITSNANNHIVICGSVLNVTNLPAATNAYSGGASDAFIASFNNLNSLMWSTYYGGSAGTESGNGVVINSLGEIFLTGSTQSNNLPTPNPNSGYCDNSYAGGTLRGDAFVAQFSTSGTLTWATFIGDVEDEEGNDIAVDYMDNIYITGLTRSPNLQLPNNPTGSWDQPLHSTIGTYIISFDRWQGLIWGTFWGGESSDIGNKLHVFKNQNTSESYLYIVGYTTSDANPATANPFPLVRAAAFSSAYLQLQGLNLNNAPTSTVGDGYIAAFDLSAVVLDISDGSQTQSGIYLAPNPNRGEFVIYFEREIPESTSCSIFNSIGQQIYLESNITTTQDGSLVINLKNCESGVYLVKLSSDNFTYSTKVIIQK